MREIRVPLLPAWLRWAGVATVAGVIFYLSIVTTPPSDPVVPGTPDLIPLDKWRHFLAYAALAGSLAYATTDWEWPTRRLAAFVLGVAILFGVGIEIWQGFIPERFFDVSDIYANSLGALLVSPFYLVRDRLAFVPVVAWSRSLRP